MVHYNPFKPLTLTYDTSPYGIEALLTLCEQDGQELPMHSHHEVWRTLRTPVG